MGVRARTAKKSVADDPDVVARANPATYVDSSCSRTGGSPRMAMLKWLQDEANRPRMTPLLLSDTTLLPYFRRLALSTARMRGLA
jgi:hypothetical protein